jgi:hypothetical protein
LKTLISWCIGGESNILKIFICSMIKELSQYDMGIAFKQKWVKKYWTLITMEHMETKEIHNYAIDLNKW